MKEHTTATINKNVINKVKIFSLADNRTKSGAHEQLLKIALETPEVKQIMKSYYAKLEESK